MPYPSAIPVQKIRLDYLNDTKVDLYMARADQVHPLASGNKIYKLNPILEFAKANDYTQILSFGGAYSNHIHALALMAKENAIESIAIIRGEPKYAQNPTLSECLKAGMKLQFVSREEYRMRNEEKYLAQLQQQFPDALIVPEGGSSQFAIQGCAQLARDVNLKSISTIDDGILAVASGTGATAAGLVCGLAEKQHLMAYAVLKDESLKTRIDAFIKNENSSNLDRYSIHQTDFGGYAKVDKALLDFILNWLDQTGILLDPIYTSKLCLRVTQQIKAGEFKPGQSITLIHTGGLQGWRGLEKKVNTLVGEAAWNRICESIDTQSD